MKKYPPITPEVWAFAVAGASPAPALGIRYSVAQASRQMDLYAIPDGQRTAGPLPPSTVTVNGQVAGNRPPSRILRQQLSRWNQLMLHISEWLLRARSRSELMNLSDRTLRDIGVSRYDAEFEASKPFWMA